MNIRRKNDKWTAQGGWKVLPENLCSVLSGASLRCIYFSRLPNEPECIESRVAAWIPDFLKGSIPFYRVDSGGLTISPPSRLATSIKWRDIERSIDFAHEVNTEYEGLKSAPKLLVLYTKVGACVVRQRLPLPKIREPILVSAHENSWEVSRAALLQLIRNAPGQVRVSASVFVDLEIDPYSWERASLPRFATRAYLITVVVAAVAVWPWLDQLSHSIVWIIATFLVYVLFMSMVGQVVGALFLPIFFGPGIVFCDQEGLFEQPSSS